jgi:hypothetical protein
VSPIPIPGRGTSQLKVGPRQCKSENRRPRGGAGSFGIYSIVGQSGAIAFTPRLSLFTDENAQMLSDKFFDWGCG